MRTLLLGGLAATGICLAGATGAASVLAATPSSTPTAAGHRHLGRVSGEVISDSSGGGALGAGQIVVKEPDGTQLTITLASRTKAFRYQGLGAGLVSESPGAIPTGEIVIVRGRNLLGQHLAIRILDLGFQAAS